MCNSCTWTFRGAFGSFCELCTGVFTISHLFLRTRSLDVHSHTMVQRKPHPLKWVVGIVEAEIGHLVATSCELLIYFRTSILTLAFWIIFLWTRCQHTWRGSLHLSQNVILLQKMFKVSNSWEFGFWFFGMALAFVRYCGYLCYLFWQWIVIHTLIQKHQKTMCVQIFVRDRIHSDDRFQDQNSTGETSDVQN